MKPGEGIKPTVVGIISGKNNEPTTVVMACIFVHVKDYIESWSSSIVAKLRKLVRKIGSMKALNWSKK